MSTERVGGVPWVATCLHVLRELGNAETHIIRSVNRILRPEEVVATDLAFCLTCASRLLEFAHDWLSLSATAKPTP